MQVQIIAIVLVSALWGMAVATGRGGVRLSLLIGAAGLGLASAAFAGWVPDEYAMLGLFVAAIAGGIVAAKSSQERHWPWRRRAA